MSSTAIDAFIQIEFSHISSCDVYTYLKKSREEKKKKEQENTEYNEVVLFTDIYDFAASKNIVTAARSHVNVDFIPDFSHVSDGLYRRNLDEFHVLQCGDNVQ